MKFTIALLLALPAFAADDWMDVLAQQHLAKRGEQIKAIRDPQGVEQRKQYVRSKVLELLGGLPAQRSALRPRVTRTLDRGPFVIENVIFESLPDYQVTANLYRPKSPGKYPAVLMAMGHWDAGKPAGQLIASNLALKGFVVLAYDPVGQGERQQAYDQRLRRSIIGGSTEQHFLNGAQSLLLGQSFARYRIWDGMRALDYLTSRPEVDPDRIGCTGCSGGGTLATYISALDPRVKVAAPSCYMNSFRTVFSGPVGDSEQSLPNFISSGLDETDYVELFAPKPWLISSTEGDYFTPAGAKQVFEEARNWYELHRAQDRIKWVVGPGGHGTPLVVREGIYEWMIRWLQNGKGNPKEQHVDLVADMELWATDNGQVDGRDLYEFIRQTPRQPASSADLARFVRDLLEGNPPAGRTGKLDGSTLVIDAPKSSPQYSGNWLPNTRAWLIGRNLPATHASEIRTAIQGDRVVVKASGVSGIWALLAAVADERIAELVLDRTPYSYASALDSPVHSNLHDAVIPGFALRWDLQDLVKAIAPRKVRWVNPTDWLGNVVKLTGSYEYTSSDPNQNR